jgi:hypothetical protein
VSQPTTLPSGPVRALKGFNISELEIADKYRYSEDDERKRKHAGEG